MSQDQQTQSTSKNDLIINQLQFLLGTLRDGKKGFADAAEHADDPNLAQLLLARSEQRGAFEQEIADQIRTLGGTPDEHSSVGAALHRAWLTVRDALSGTNDYSIVSECARGEEIAVQNYGDVLGEMHLPGDIRALVQRQFAQVKDSQALMLDLKQEMKKEK